MKLYNEYEYKLFDQYFCRGRYANDYIMKKSEKPNKFIILQNKIYYVTAYIKGGIFYVFKAYPIKLYEFKRTKKCIYYSMGEVNYNEPMKIDRFIIKHGLSNIKYSSSGIIIIENEEKK